MTQIEICACGHPLGRHELVGTEYVRCQKHLWKCYCTGDSRVVLLVNETLEKPSASQTNAKYFRRVRKPGIMGHPLNAGLSRIQELDVPYEWTIDECESCGLTRETDLTAIHVDGIVSGKHQGVCGICIFEIEEAERRRNG